MSYVVRMNMGQKASAKVTAKAALAAAAEGEMLNMPTHPSEMKERHALAASVEDIIEAPAPQEQEVGLRAAAKEDDAITLQHDAFTPQGASFKRPSTPPKSSPTLGLSKTLYGVEFAEGQCPRPSVNGVHGMHSLDRRIDTLRARTSGLHDEEAWQRKFNVIMGAIIVLNIVVIAIETDAVSDTSSLEDRIVWIIIDSLFILVFVFEVAVRAWIERWNWFRSCWNWFDVVIIIMAMVDVWLISFMSGTGADGLYIMSIFRIVRLVRLVRLVKLVRLLHGLYVILTAFWHAMQTMSFLMAIMLFGLVIYAIFAVNLFGRNSVLKDVRINGDTIYDRFGTVYRSMYSLFELMTLEGWESVARPIVEEMPISFLFIVSFIMIFTFGMLNMVVALVIEKTLLHTRMMSEDALQAQREDMADELLRIRTMFSSGNQATHGTLTAKEFETALKENEAVRAIFHKMGTSTQDARELFAVLDWDESGDVTVREFLEGLQKLQDGVASPWDTLATHAIARNVKGQVTEISERLSRQSKEEEAWRQGVAERLDSQEKMLQEILAHLKLVGTP